MPFKVMLRIKKIEKLLRNPYKLFSFASSKKIFRLLGDEMFLKLKFHGTLGMKLDLNNPKTFSEKLQWLKLYDRKPEYTQMVDKYEVRKYIAKSIGEEYLIPLLGVYSKFEDINFDVLPNQFVLKPNHTSGDVFICKDKSAIDFARLKKEINMWLKRSYYWAHREWPYKNVKPRIIAEQYMTDGDGRDDLLDYKVHNFNGVPKMVLVCEDRFSEHGMSHDIFTAEWEHIPVQRHASRNSEIPIEKPVKLKEMLELSQRLSVNIPFVRTDFYTVQNKVYFGELTFYPGTGMLPFEPDSYDKMFGDWLVLPAPESVRGGVILLKGNTYVLIHTQAIAEEVLTDYKFMCFSGKVKCSFTGTERFSSEGLKVTFFDRNWNRMPFARHYPSSSKEIKKPEQYEKMLELAEQLSTGIPFVRVDFYEVSGKIYFGEMTFYPGTGMEEFEPEEWDYTLGDWIELPEKRS